MKKSDRILQELRKGTPLEKIRRKFNDPKASLYTAFTLYFAEVDIEIENKQKKYAALNSRVSELQERLKSLEKKVGEHEKQRGEMVEALERQSKKLETLREFTRDKRGELSEINLKIADLAKSGITKEILTRIYTMEMESGEDLLERVKTSADHAQISEENAKLRKENTNIEKNIASLERKRAQLRKEVHSWRNRLDDAKLKVRTFKEAVVITRSLLNEGYTTVDIQALKDGLETAGIKDEPGRSITRLVTSLEDVKSLDDLKDQIQKKENELKTIKANVNLVKGELEAYKKTVLKTLSEVKDQATTMIRNTGKSAASKIYEFCRNTEKNLENIDTLHTSKTDEIRKTSEKGLNAISASHISQLKTVGQRALISLSEAEKIARGIVHTLKTQTERSLTKFDSHISATMEKITADFEKWTNLEEKVKEYERMMKYGYILFGILENPEGIRELPLPLVAQLIGRVHSYTKINFPNELTSPSKNVCRLSGFSPYFPYNLSSLTLRLKEDFEKRALEDVEDEARA